MSDDSFVRLYNMGDHMLASLESGDLEKYFELLRQRGTLLDTILEYEHPSELDANWEETAAALSRQQTALAEAAESRIRTMQDALTRLEQVKEAQRSYQQPQGQRHILHENLRV